MTRIRTIAARYALVLGILASTGRAVASPEAEIRESPGASIVQAELHASAMEAMNLLYRGRVEEALAAAERMASRAPNDPLPYLIQARVLRDFVSDQNWKRESLKPQNEPIHAVLETATELATEMLERDPDSVTAYLYRGWAHMFRGQLHALAFENWSAGGKARAGKSDLDRVVAADPDDPNAKMILGTYLYFADTLPAALKFAQFLLRIPRGDGPRGLELLETAGSRESYLRDDARGMFGGALFGFEGRLEDGLDVFEGLLADYPHNVRLAEPIAVMDFFFPERLARDLPRIQDVVSHNLVAGDSVMSGVASRVRLYESLALLATGHVDEGYAALGALHERLPAEPDWLEADVTILLAEFALMAGDRDRALALHESADPEWKERLEFVNGPGAAATESEVEQWRDLAGAARHLYAGHLGEARRELDRYEDEESPLIAFYRGELAFVAGRGAEALEHYAPLVENDARSRFRFLEFLATVRTAEILGWRGDASEAASLLTEAVDDYPVKDLLRHVTKARARFFENGRPGAPES